MKYHLKQPCLLFKFLLFPCWFCDIIGIFHLKMSLKNSNSLVAITHSSITVLVCYSLFIFDIWNAWVVILWIAYPLNKGKTMQHFSNDLNIKNCQHGTGLLPLIYKSLLTDVSTREDYLPLFMKTYWQRQIMTSERQNLIFNPVYVRFKHMHDKQVNSKQKIHPIISISSWKW
jgi:hypothetical protein